MSSSCRRKCTRINPFCSKAARIVRSLRSVAVVSFLMWNEMVWLGRSKTLPGGTVWYVKGVCTVYNLTNYIYIYILIHLISSFIFRGTEEHLSGTASKECNGLNCWQCYSLCTGVFAFIFIFILDVGTSLISIPWFFIFRWMKCRCKTGVHMSKEAYFPHCSQCGTAHGLLCSSFPSALSCTHVRLD